MEIQTSSMNPRMQEFTQLADKCLHNLLKEHKTCRFNFSLDMKSHAYDALEHTISRADMISKLIKAKPFYEREAYFVTGAISLYRALEQGNNERAEFLKSELEYFRHCFLEDSFCWRMPLDHETLAKFLE
jgi:hypothetical protein